VNLFIVSFSLFFFPYTETSELLRYTLLQSVDRYNNSSVSNKRWLLSGRFSSWFRFWRDLLWGYILHRIPKDISM